MILPASTRACLWHPSASLILAFSTRAFQGRYPGITGHCMRRCLAQPSVQAIQQESLPFTCVSAIAPHHACDLISITSALTANAQASHAALLVQAKCMPCLYIRLCHDTRGSLQPSREINRSQASTHLLRHFLSDQQYSEGLSQHVQGHLPSDTRGHGSEQP